MKKLFDYLNLEEKTEILNCLEGKEINENLLATIEQAAKLHLPKSRIIALICYRLKLESDDEEVMRLVSRLEALKLSEEVARNPENEKKIYRELFITLGNSIDVIMLKLSMELVKLRQNKGKRDDIEIQMLAKMSQDIYAPLCHRLGLGEMKTEFEDLSLYVLNHEVFFELAKKLSLKKDERERLISEMIDSINTEISEHIGEYKIFGRSKHIYSIHNKLTKFDKTYDDIYDLLAIRIICETEVECYTALGMIHQLYPPLDSRFKDYIARPKPNMYQSLHTSVKGPGNQIYEIQIRTFAMDCVAELGIAAHVAYKEGTSASTDVAKQLMNLKNFVASGEFETDDYKRILEQHILDDHIYAFTPARKIIALPYGATVVDFAFKIHTKVGEQMVGAKVNGKIANYSQPLITNDVVEILTKNNAPGPNETWLEYAKTTHARNKIKNYLRKKVEIDNEATYERGRELLYNELKKRNLDRTILDDSKRKNEIMREFKFTSVYDVLEAIAEHKITPREIVDYLTKEKEKPKDVAIKFVTNTNSKKGVIIPGAEDIKYELSKCCLPIYGDEIVARAKNGVAFKIHRSVCKESGDNCLAAHWNGTTEGVNKYSTKIKIVAINNESLLNDIINVMSASNTGVVDLKKSQSNDTITMIVTVSVYDIVHLNVAIANIQKNNLIKTVQRI